MSRIEVIVYLPDMLMHRMKALAITSPAAIVEHILAWLDDEQIANAIIESRVLTRCTVCTRLLIRLPDPLAAYVQTQTNVDLALFVETVMTWVKDENLHEAQQALRYNMQSNQRIMQEAAGWIAAENFHDTPEIWDAMRGFSPQARREAASLLAWAGAAAVPGLRGLLYDSRISTRLSAIRTLGIIGSPTVIDDLRKLLTDPDPVISEAAGRALHRIGTPEALAWVDAWKRKRSK